MKTKGARQLRSGRSLSARSWLVIGVAILLLGGGALLWGLASPRPSMHPATPTGGKLLQETKPPLSASLFVGKVAEAYQVAHEIPEVLDKLYCYCGCDKSVGHKSLLSCFTDSHAAG